MTEHSNLLHPELIHSVPLTGGATADRLSNLVGGYAAKSSKGMPGISIAIRTLNEAETLEPLLQDISEQRFDTEPEVIVVDNDSSDQTAQIARAYGARVVSYPREEFTYARSLNLAMNQASNDYVFTTVGHSLLSNRQTLIAAMSQLQKPNAAGVFARTLPGANASTPERLIAAGNIAYMKPASVAKAQKLAVANLGLFAAQNVAVSRDAWLDLGGFNEAWESGGEDTDFAIRAMESGADIIEDQVIAVHHTHGLDFMNYVKQWAHWAKTLTGPRKLDLDSLKRRRPDLDFS